MRDRFTSGVGRGGCVWIGIGRDSDGTDGFGAVDLVGEMLAARWLGAGALILGGFADGCKRRGSEDRGREREGEWTCGEKGVDMELRLRSWVVLN